ncbi:MAG: NAD(P)-dependent oxidoreductase [Proteobacteria bacterium]|nr:NAD(P)-dependent oxidoreductase [Pseudomonadota bacterium]
MSQRVLVTGANGYIGKYCVPFLIKSGFKVFAVSSQREGLDSDGVEWLKTDLLKESLLSILIKTKPSHCLHLAWYAEHGKFWTSPLNSEWARASKQLLADFFASGGTRFVSSGSCAEYSWTGHCEEGVTLEVPGTLYGQCKKEFSDYVLMYARQSQVSCAVGRVFFLYGPGEPKNRLVPAMINSFLNNTSPRCSDGEQLRDFMSVEDVAAGLVELLKSKVNGVVNIASGAPMTVKSLVQEIAHLTDSKVPILFGSVPRPVGDPDVLTASTQRLNSEVGFRPQVSLTLGLRKSIAWAKLGEP